MTLVALLLASAGCTGLRIELAPTQECDPSWRDKDAQYIEENFNLHRGRWWDYYRRGQCYLALELYKQAKEDFTRAIRIRDRDQWDARTYGMHFIDYFPHRERGIALYYQSMEIAPDADKQRRQNRQDLLLEAIDDLKKSHRQQESSRAKFFLNDAQKAFWQGTDLTAPDVNVPHRIYTNQSRVPVLVRASDRESGVARIRVTGPDNRPLAGYTFELAEKTKSKEITVPIDLLKSETVVKVTCADVLDNESVPHDVNIVVDTSPPSAAFTLDTRVPDPDGRISVRVVAEDDQALESIQIGEDVGDTYDCRGQSGYTDMIRGVPKEDELTVRIVDKAQNAMVSRILLSKASVASGRSQVGQPWAQPAVLFAGRAVSGPHRQYSSPFARFGAPHDVLYRYTPESRRSGSGRAGPDLLTERPMPAESEMMRRYEFDFPPHVRPPQSSVKETSNDIFYVDGTFYGAGDVNRITVDDCEVRSFVKRGENRAFAHTVSLAELEPNQTKKIWVKAFRPDDPPNKPCKEECIQVRKVEPADMRLDSVLGIAVQRLIPGDLKTCESSTEDTILGKAHESIIASLRKLPLHPSCPNTPRFRVYDDSRLGERVPFSTNRRVPGARDRLRGSDEVDCADIVVSGRISRDCHHDEERFEIKLTAADASSEKDLCFPNSGRDPKGRLDIPVLAEVYGRSKDFQWYVEELLAAKVAERFPRLEARIEKVSKKGDTSLISRGRADGLFPGMKVCLYKKQVLDRNAKVTLVCGGEVDTPDPFTATVVITDASPSDPRLLKEGDIAIPK